MKDEIIAEVHRENLSTYFILPLLKLNKDSFSGELNFCDSYLSKDLRYVYAEVREVASLKHRMLMHPDFEAVWRRGDRYYVQYKIPHRWKADVSLFAEGKYSKMSKGAKDTICELSGLLYRERLEPGRIPITDMRLLALTRAKSLRLMWEEKYNVALSDEDELLSLPGTRIFINEETLVLYPE